MKNVLAIILFGISMTMAQVAGATGYTGASSAGAASATGATGPTAAPQTTGIHTPFFLGAALGFGSGTGVGSERGLGLRQIEPMFGIWFPGVGYIRAGYGFFEYQEEANNKEKSEIDHSDLAVELGVHVLGELYGMGSYSRVKELSDLGDVAWNEWGAGFGTLMNIFSKTMLFAEVQYRWVLDHYDPFLERTVNGSRLQFNIGFAAYVY